MKTQKFLLIRHLYGSNTYCRIHKSVIRMEYVHNTHCENPPRSNKHYILKIYFLTYAVYCGIYELLLSFARFPPWRRRPSGLCAERSACVCS